MSKNKTNTKRSQADPMPPLHVQLQQAVESAELQRERQETHNAILRGDIRDNKHSKIVFNQFEQQLTVVKRQPMGRYPVTAEDRAKAVRFAREVLDCDPEIKHQMQAASFLLNADKINLMAEKNDLERKKLKLLQQPKLHLHGHVPIGTAARELIQSSPQFIEFLRQQALERDTIEGEVYKTDNTDDGNEPERRGTNPSDCDAGAIRATCQPEPMEDGAALSLLGQADYEWAD